MALLELKIMISFDKIISKSVYGHQIYLEAFPATKSISG